MKIQIDDLLEESEESIYDLIRKSVEEATRNDIKANSIVINRNMVRVPGWEGRWPEMICGLNCYFTAKDLPDGYSFAVLNDCNKETENNWISVKDRLPEPMEWVLCACRANIIEVLRYDHIMDDWDTTMPNRCYMKGFVTHWMPLPQPPKGE